MAALAEGKEEDTLITDSLAVAVFGNNDRRKRVGDEIINFLCKGGPSP
jgi:hypothetical protein